MPLPGRRLALFIIIAAPAGLGPDRSGPGLAAQQPARQQARPMNLDQVRRAVVTVRALDAGGERVASGTGFFVEVVPNLDLVVTAAHVLEDAAGCRVELHDGQVLRCTRYASDTSKDVLMLKVSGQAPSRLGWGSSDGMKDGDEVTIVSNPLGQLPGTVARGIVSAQRVIRGTKLFQLTAPISHGSSGAPVLSGGSRVIGIVRSTIEEGQALNFATATDAVRNLWQDRASLDEAEALTRIASVPAASPGGAAGRRIAAGQSVTGQLTAGDALYEDTTYYQEFEFTATAGGAVTIDLVSADFDPYLLVTGGDLERALSDDDGGPGCSARVAHTFRSRGPYRILVNTTNDPYRQTGRYTLTVAPGPKSLDKDDECQPPQRRTRDRTADHGQVRTESGDRAIAVGQTIQGDLTRADHFRDSDSTFAQTWTFEGRAGQTVTVDLESDDFDAYLFLAGPGIERNLQDDDSGGNCNARLTVTLSEGGTYTAVVNTANKYGTGRFTLSVTSGSKSPSLSRCERSD